MTKDVDVVTKWEIVKKLIEEVNVEIDTDGDWFVLKLFKPSEDVTSIYQTNTIEELHEFMHAYSLGVESTKYKKTAIIEEKWRYD